VIASPWAGNNHAWQKFGMDTNFSGMFVIASQGKSIV
jgi:hypothetical protein